MNLDSSMSLRGPGLDTLFSSLAKQSDVLCLIFRPDNVQYASQVSVNKGVSKILV